MASVYPFLIEVFAVLCTFVSFSSGDPAGCYYCNTDADGAVCNTPLDASAVRVQLCNDSSVVDSNAVLAEATNTTERVCSTLTYYRSGSRVTIRGCENSIVSNRALCTYLTQTITSTNYVTNFSCQTCATNLCNTASYPQFSIAVLVAAIFIALHHY